MVTFRERMPPPTGVVRGPLDADLELVESLERLLRQPLSGLVVRLFAGVDLHPRDAALAPICLGDRGIDDGLRGTPDVGTDSVSLDERDNRSGRHHRFAGFYRDPLAIRRGRWRSCIRSRNAPLQCREISNQAGPDSKKGPLWSPKDTQVMGQAPSILVAHLLASKYLGFSGFIRVFVQGFFVHVRAPSSCV